MGMGWINTGVACVRLIPPLRPYTGGDWDDLDPNIQSKPETEPDTTDTGSGDGRLVTDGGCAMKNNGLWYGYILIMLFFLCIVRVKGDSV